MSSRTTWTLLLLALGLGAFIFLFERHLQPAGKGDEPVRVFPDLSPAKVTAVIIRPAGRPELVTVRTNASWQLLKPILYPAAPANVEVLLEALRQLASRSRITARDLKDRPDYGSEFGFDDAQFSLVIQQGDVSTQILIGKRTPFGDELFFQVVGRNEIYVVGADLLRFVPRSADDWRELVLLPDLKTLAYDRLIVTNSGKIFELRRDPASGLWQLARPLEARADNPRLETLLQQLQNLRFTRFVSDDPKADLDGFGLQPPGLEISFARGEEPVLSLQFGHSPTNHPDQCFARRADTYSIGLVSKDQLAPWRGSFEEFRDHHLVTLTAQSISQVIVQATNSFSLRRITNGTWRVTSPEDLPADAALVGDFIGTLGGLTVAQFVKSVVTELDLPNYGLTAPTRQITLLSGESNLVVRLDFGTSLGDRRFVRRGDETAVYAVQTAALENLPTEGWQLRDRRLWNFPEHEVTGLTLRQNGKVMELLRHGTNQWTFAAGSQGVLDGFRVEEVAGTLGGLTAAFWTARGEARLADYGFTEISPRLTVALKRPDATETLTLNLGGVSASGLSYGAVTLEGQTWIFELPARVTEVLRSYLPRLP